MRGSSSARRLSFVVVALTALAVTACRGGSDSGDEPTSGAPRPFQMGISTLPRELNAQSYGETFKLAGTAGEMVLIQRVPPWAEFMPGSSVSSETTDNTAAELAAIADENLELFFAIDPTEGTTGRDRLAGLPPSHEGRGFDDADVRSAFVSYAEYIAINYKPAYLALGVEMNLYYEQNNRNLDDFGSLYEETYNRVKAIAPDTRVTVTFQYEDMQSLLPTEDRHIPNWQLIARFEDSMDVMAISTHPSFAYSRVSDIPPKYYSQLRGFTEKPIVFAEIGFASETGEQGVNSGSEAEQAAFVARALDEAEKLNAPFVIWFAGWDPAYAASTAFSAFEHIGLLRADGSEKPAWAVWRAAAQRPYAPPSN